MAAIANVTLQGVLTERDLSAAENEFPGITSFLANCSVKPKTFLELVFAYEWTRG